MVIFHDLTFNFTTKPQSSFPKFVGEPNHQQLRADDTAKNEQQRKIGRAPSA